MDDRYIRNNDCETVNIGDEIGMLDVETGTYYVLDSVSVDIWNLLEKEISIGELVDHLMKTYTVDQEICKNDVEKFLEDAYEKKLVVRV